MDFPNQNPQPFQPPVPPAVNGPTPPTMMGAPAGVSSPAPAIPVPPAPVPIQIPIQNEPGSTTGEDQVYSMPEKFLAPNQPPVAQKKKSHKTLTIVLMSIIVLAILAIIGGVLFYFFYVLPATQTDNTVVVNTNNSINQTPENNNAATNNALTNNTNNINNSTIDNANTDLNANSAVNTNENVNTITGIDNANTNTNENVNTANANGDVNTNVTTPVIAADSDGDALTSEEEKMWGTKAELPDTDSDGYTDGVELLAGYDPVNSTSAGRLSDSGAIGKYANKTNGYSMYYPIGWVPEALTEGSDTDIIFTPNTLETAGEFIEVIVEKNPAGLIATEWYSEQADVTVDQLQTVTTFSGLVGVLSVDGYTAYFTTNNNVYAVSYHYGNSPEVNFTSTFRVMVNSFDLTKKAQQANDAVNGNTNTVTNDNVNNEANTND